MARVSLDTLKKRSIRNMGAVHPVVKEKALQIIEKAYSEGMNVQISSGYRSHAEQQRLYNQGRTTRGNIVTNAKPGQSVHNYGLAIDYFLTNHDGRQAIWTVNKDWRRVAQIGKSLGFSWGGDWQSYKDYSHLELTGGLTWRDLQAGKRPHHLLSGGSSVKEVLGGEEMMNPTSNALKKDYENKLNQAVRRGIINEKWLNQYREGKLKVSDAIALNMLILSTQPSNKVYAAHAEAWRKAVEQGVLNGERPNDPLTRSEFATVANRLNLIK